MKLFIFHGLLELHRKNRNYFHYTQILWNIFYYFNKKVRQAAATASRTEVKQKLVNERN
mgnify:CR=1 FL=1